MQDAPPLSFFSLHASRRRGVCSPHQTPSSVPTMRELAPATVAATFSGCRRTATAAPLSMVPLVVEASSEDDIQAEMQAVKERKSWACP